MSIVVTRPQPIRISRVAGLGRADLAVAGVAACVFSADPAQAGAAALAVRRELEAMTAACGRLGPGSGTDDHSELEVANRAGGHHMALSPRLAEAVDAALRVAAATDGLVDPTTSTAGDPPGWEAVRFNRDWGTLDLPAGLGLRLDDTAPAVAADRAAARAAEAADGGVLVNLGRFIALGGPAPAGGWNITVANPGGGGPAPVVRVGGGGVATFGIPDRPGPWRTASVAAPTCVDALIAAAAALGRAEQAPAWLDAQGLAARLVRTDGSGTLVGSWAPGALAA